MHPMQFVDRDGQVETVLAYAAEADAGTGRLVLVEGEAGVGKSTLLEQVEARLPDATWHWGACDGLFTPLPLAPLRDIADDVGGPLLEACRTDASRETLFAALVEAIRATDGLTVLVCRGRPLGRRGHPRPPAAHRAPHPEGARPAARHLPRRRVRRLRLRCGWPSASSPASAPPAG